MVTSMPGEANVVNMADRPYHHGALRQALMTEGLKLLAESDADHLSLRELARKVGVSATAVYRHFPDKHALLAALARQGLEQLAAAQHAASEAAGGGEEGFNATGLAYVDFAIGNPALFRLISAYPTSEPSMTRPADRMPEAMSFLLANAAEFAPPGTDRNTFALQSWALAHGMAMLILDGQVVADQDLVAAVVDGTALAGRPGKHRSSAKTVVEHAG